MANISNMSSASKSAVSNAARTSVREARRRPSMMLPKDIGTVLPTAVSPASATSNLAVGATLTGQTAALTFTPSDTYNKSGTWTSSNPAVVSVEDAALGNFTARSAGTAVLTFYGNNGVTTAINVTSAAPVAVTGVTVSPTTASVAVGATQQLTPTVAPSNASNKSVTYSTSDATKATVNSSGLVTGVAAGSATITVTTVDGSKTATCAVTVTA